MKQTKRNMPEGQNTICSEDTVARSEEELFISQDYSTEKYHQQY
jgi:hypothetical protein